MGEEDASVEREMLEWAFRRRAHLVSVMILGLVAAAGRMGDAARAGPAREPPVPPPPDAVALFNGGDLSGWARRGSGAPARWKAADGVMEVVPGTGDIHTTRDFTDFQLHVEFNVPYMPNAHGQARGNSGVYLQASYEIQVLDSYGLNSKNDDCGAVYGQTPPMVNACRPPEEWQTYDILFHAPRFDAAGQMVEKARVSVLQNNRWIQDNVAIDGPTRASMERDVRQPGPIMLQDHGSRVIYRDIWIRPLTTKAGMSKTGIVSD
jgi:hypothetical protein